MNITRIVPASTVECCWHVGLLLTLATRSPYTTRIGVKQSAHYSHLASLHNTSMNRQSKLHALVQHNVYMICPAVMNSNTATVQYCTCAANCSHQVAKFVLLSMQSTYEYDSGTEPNLPTPAATLTFLKFFLVVFIPNKLTCLWHLRHLDSLLKVISWCRSVQLLHMNAETLHGWELRLVLVTRDAKIEALSSVGCFQRAGGWFSHLQELQQKAHLHRWHHKPAGALEEISSSGSGCGVNLVGSDNQMWRISRDLPRQTRFARLRPLLIWAHW